MKHAHEEYQIGLSLDSTSGYTYRGASHCVPIGALSIIHPGAAHRSREFVEFRASATYRMMYVSPALLRDTAAEIAGRESGEPFSRPPSCSTETLPGVFWSRAWRWKDLSPASKRIRSSSPCSPPSCGVTLMGASRRDQWARSVGP